MAESIDPGEDPVTDDHLRAIGRTIVMAQPQPRTGQG